MTYRQDILFSLILSPDRCRDFRGFCLFILVYSQWNISKKSRSNNMPCLSLLEFMLLIFKNLKNYLRFFCILSCWLVQHPSSKRDSRQAGMTDNLWNRACYKYKVVFH